MTETKDKPLEHITPDPTEMLLAEAEVLEKDPKKPHREKTAGEVAFNRGVYTGVGLITNEVSAILIADEFQNRSGKKLFENISQGMVKAFNFKDVVKNGKMITAHQNASSMLMWASLLISGSLLVYPMKKLEDNKGYWVKKANHFFDKMRGNAMAPEDVAERDNEVEKAIACEAKQTWSSLLIGRAIAVATVLGLGKAIGTERSDKIMDFAEKGLMGSIQPVGQKNRWHSYAAVLPLETLACTTSSVALEMFSKLFAKRGVTVRNPELCTAIVHEQLPEYISNGNANMSDKDTKQVTPCEPCAASKADAYKKKPIAKMESHVDALKKASETSYSLAP